MKSAPRAAERGAAWRRRAWAGLLAGCGLALAPLTAPAQGASKGLDDLKQDRLTRTFDKQEAKEKAETEMWTLAKTVVNINARCPVISSLGYFGAFASTDKDPSKAAELQVRYLEFLRAVQPIADELKQMATGTPIVGTTFPPALDKRLAALSAQLNGAIIKQYGEESLRELQKFVAAQTAGAVVGRGTNVTP